MVKIAKNLTNFDCDNQSYINFWAIINIAIYY